MQYRARILDHSKLGNCFRRYHRSYKCHLCRHLAVHIRRRMSDGIYPGRNKTGDYAFCLHQFPLVGSSISALFCPTSSPIYSIPHSRFVSSDNAQAAEKTTQSKTHLFNSSLLRDERFLDVYLSGNSLLSSAHGETKKSSVYFIPLKLPINLTFTFLINEALQFSLKILRSIISLGFSSWHYRIINNLGLI